MCVRSHTVLAEVLRSVLECCLVADLLIFIVEVPRYFVFSCPTPRNWFCLCTERSSCSSATPLNAGVTVNYKDVESIDPEYAKNLQVCS